MVTSPENPAGPSAHPTDPQNDDQPAAQPDAQPAAQPDLMAELFGGTADTAKEAASAREHEHAMTEHTSTGPTAEPMTTRTAATTPLPPLPPTPEAAAKRRRPQFGTIVWGVLLLVFAAFMVVWTVVPTTPDPTLWLLGAVIVTGILLVVAGIVAAARRAG